MKNRLICLMFSLIFVFMMVGCSSLIRVQKASGGMFTIKKNGRKSALTDGYTIFNVNSGPEFAGMAFGLTEYGERKLITWGLVPKKYLVVPLGYPGKKNKGFYYHKGNLKSDTSGCVSPNAWILQFQEKQKTLLGREFKSSMVKIVKDRPGYAEGSCVGLYCVMRKGGRIQEIIDSFEKEQNWQVMLVSETHQSAAEVKIIKFHRATSLKRVVDYLKKYEREKVGRKVSIYLIDNTSAIWLNGEAIERSGELQKPNTPVWYIGRKNRFLFSK